MRVGVIVGVGVMVGVEVIVGVGVMVGVSVIVGVSVMVGVGVELGVMVGVGDRVEGGVGIGITIPTATITDMQVQFALMNSPTMSRSHPLMLRGGNLF